MKPVGWRSERVHIKTSRNYCLASVIFVALRGRATSIYVIRKPVVACTTNNNWPVFRNLSFRAQYIVRLSAAAFCEAISCDAASRKCVIQPNGFGLEDWWAQNCSQHIEKRCHHPHLAWIFIGNFFTEMSCSGPIHPKCSCIFSETWDGFISRNFTLIQFLRWGNVFDLQFEYIHRAAKYPVRVAAKQSAKLHLSERVASGSSEMAITT